MDFKFLINKNNIKELNCILLPIDAVLKALNDEKNIYHNNINV